MCFDIDRLVSDLHDSEMVIYGAGKYAKIMYAILNVYEMAGKVKYFVVSEIDEPGTVEGIQIISVKQLKELGEIYTIVVAVSEWYLTEIKANLAGVRSNGLFFMADYERDDGCDASCLFGKNKGDFVDYILNGLISCQKITSSRELENVKKELLCYSINRRSEKENLIVFVASMISARIMRIAVALKDAGYEIKFYKLINYEYVGEKELNDKGITVKQCSNPQEMFYEIVLLSPYACYLDPFREGYLICQLMVCFKLYFGKIILAPYDIENGGTVGEDNQIYTFEKYCFENADGIIWRYFAKDFLEEKMGFAYKGKSISFPDCCEDVRIAVKQKRKNILKICCMPNHASEALEKNVALSKYTHEVTMWEVLDKIGNRKDCVFHVFFWNVREKERELLEQLKKQFFNFDYFIHIDHKELLESILPNYDYGFSMNTEGEIPEYPEGIDIGMGLKRSENVLKNGSSNKFFDFISAGLPVIATIPTALCQYLDKYGVIIDMDLEHFDIEYLKDNKLMFHKNVSLAKPQLLISNHISSLVEFIEDFRKA